MKNKRTGRTLADLKYDVFSFVDDLECLKEKFDDVMMKSDCLEDLEPGDLKYVLEVLRQVEQNETNPFKAKSIDKVILVLETFI